MSEKTEKHLKENNIISNNDEYLRFFENTSIGIYRASNNGNSIKANPALLAIHGFANEQELHKSLSKDKKTLSESINEWYVEPGRRDQLTQELSLHNKLENIESEVYRPSDKKKIWVNENVWNIRDEEGNVLYYEGTVEDISERKHTQVMQESLIEFIEESLKKGPNENFHKNLLEKAMSIVANTEAGSLLIKTDEGNYKIVATANLNHNGLKDFIFAPHELLANPKEPTLQNLEDHPLKDIHPKRLKILKEHGRIHELKASLTVPIILGNDVAALLQLSNFTNKNAFNNATKTVTLFAKQIAALLKRLNAEKELLAKQTKLEHWAKFRAGLIGFMANTLKTGLNEQFYQNLLEQATEVIPNAQAGSILYLSKENTYSFIAAIGYELTELQTVKFIKSELRFDTETQISLITADILKPNELKSNPKKQEKLSHCGRSRDIKSFLSLPVIQDNEIVALLNLDAFTENAFDSDAREMAAAFATQIGTLIQRLNLEQKLEASNNKLFQLANYDALTELPNRYLFNDRLKHAIKQAKRTGNPVSLLYLDLDGFKTINDSLGHSFGDQLLIAASTRLELCVRESDTVARLGGDEFAIIITDNKDRSQSTLIATKVLRALSQSFDFEEEDREIHISTSIGIASYPRDGSNSEDLLKNADLAMYHAKAQGKSRYHFFNLNMNEQLLEEIRLEHDMRKGLNSKQFTLMYQPRIHLETGQITSYEALMRWNHPKLGPISPATFIPLAEKTDLICQLGEQVIKEALKETKKLHQQGIRVRIAVNLSARQLHQQNLVQIIRTQLEQNKLHPKWLELEITESTAMTNVEDTIDVLTELQDMGIYISVDDFGTAYSSLNYLKRLPVNSLKIDQSFLRDVHEEHDESADAAIVKAIIALASSMNYTVVAEGVETHEQLAFLQAQGCQEAQGYLFAKPQAPYELRRQSFKELIEARTLNNDMVIT